MSFCFSYNVVSENYSVQNSLWEGRGVYGQPKVYKDSLQQQIHYNGNIFGNKCCHGNERVHCIFVDKIGGISVIVWLKKVPYLQLCKIAI